ncbi:MAG TPA: radical SAM protein [Desulfomonilia bacterium]|nr:radical SAM protein [Desulfomonilia bacterium]
MHEPEHLVIRPPSEARSLLVRTIRGCNWNRCNFCGIYDFFDTPFSERGLEEVLMDIDALADRYGNIFRTAFLGDANPLHLPTEFLTAVLRHLRKTFPGLERVTSYARASSLAKKTGDELKAIRHAGLDRVHVGMESGSDAVLRLQKKGTSQAQLIEAGKKTMASGMELSYYFLLGLGGQELWEDHVKGSALVLNAVKPHFVRVRRLWIHPMSRLMEKIRTGEFSEQTPEGTVVELRDLIAGLEPSPMFFTCDHANNYIQVHGRIDEHRDDMLRLIDTFLALPEGQRQEHYRAVPSVI